MPLVSKAFGDIITFERASTGTFFNSAGVLTSAAIDAPRFDYNPTTLAAQGLLIEEQRVNSIRNNTGVGAVAGTPGTIPTNWVAQAVGGVAFTEVVGTGTENGITYIDVRYAGTTSSTAAGGITTESATQIIAASGQTWASSFYIRLVGGSTSGITDIFNAIQERDAGGALLVSTTTSVTPTNAALNTQRPATTRLLTNASTARITQQIRLLPASGVAIDITLRIGLPQLELGAFATSVIPTTTTAVTRSADVASVNTLSPWYNATSGTLYAEFLPGNLSANGIAVEVGDGGLNNRFNIELQPGTSLRTWARVSVAGVLQIDIPINNTLSLTVPTKSALAVETNNTNLAANGTAGTTDTSCAVPTVNKMQIGNVNTGSGSALNGWVRRLTYYPRRLSNAELVSITT